MHMQTFLPLESFADSARALDYRRLGKQRSEVYQILRALSGDTLGWANHPVTVAWRGHERALCDYGLAMCSEWVRRGYRDTREPLIRAMAERFPPAPRPTWSTDPAVHEAYRRLLVGKNREHYVGVRGWRDEAADQFDYTLLGWGRKGTPGGSA